VLAAIVIVALKQAGAKEAVLSRFAPSEYTVVARWHNIAGFAIDIDPTLIPKLEADPFVKRVDVDTGGSGSLAQSIPLIGGDKVHALGYTGRGITVAVLDTGVDETHPDLAGGIVDEQCFCRNFDGSGCCPNGQTSQAGAGAAKDDHGHGSNVAGIIGSRGVVSSVGVAPGVNYVVVKVLDSSNRFASTSQVISALDWLIDHHPEVRAVNMSLGTDALFAGYCDSVNASTMAFASAINTLRSGGTLTVVSSGNEASATGMESPACIQNAISVGAVYDANVGPVSFNCTDATTTADQITCFTNSNSTLDMLAPGAIITSDWLRGGLSSFRGTSQAAPHVTGSVAILLEVQPALKPDDIETVLKATGKPILDVRNGVVIPRLDLFAAVLASLPARPRHRAAQH
jgi:subtilisin family serine protease